MTVRANQAIKAIRKPGSQGAEKSFATYLASGKEEATGNFVESWLSQVRCVELMGRVRAIPCCGWCGAVT